MLLGALCVTAPASADEAADRDARARFDEGLARVRASDFEGARVSFAQAFAVLHKPDILWNLALAEEKTDHPLEALLHFKEYIHEAPANGTDREHARKHIIELSALTGHIEVIAPTGAAITVDATRSFGFAPLTDTVDVMPGRHSISAQLGAQSKTLGIETVAGETARADLMELAPTPPSAAAAPGPPGPGAGDAQGAPEPPSGEHSFGRRMTTPQLVTVIALGGAAVTTAAIALGFGVSSSNDASRAAGLRTQNPSCYGSTSPGCQQLASTVSTQHTDYVVSSALWVTSALLVAGTAAAYFLWPTPETASIVAAPAVGQGSAGIVAVGRF